MFCAPITFLQYFKNIKPEGVLPTDVTGGRGKKTPV